MNDTKVFPARLTAHKPSGGRLDLLLVAPTSDNSWSVLCRERFTGTVTVADRFTLTLTDGATLTFPAGINAQEFAWQYGDMPLPPYIRRKPDAADRERYQTVYAAADGSIAAPTAGLHFTPELLDRIRARSVRVCTITLHVGVGTFRPVKTELVTDHRMDAERFLFHNELPRTIRETKARDGKVVGVGTTTTRALEAYFSGQCTTTEAAGTISGSTDIFIREGHSFRAIDSLITNFHLPRSTPLMLAAARAGRENLLAAYAEALSKGYRFFSYGDAMLVL